MFRDFYSGKRILVTGVAGVKGTWLGLRLLEAGAEVSGLDIRDPRPSNFHASGLAGRIDFTRGDVNDLELVRRLVDDVDGVFHLAAQPLVATARREPLETYRTNTYGTAVVLDAIRRSSRTRYGVMVTTDKVYRDKDGEPWVESDPLGASDPYPVSKAAAEWIVSDYHRTYFAESDKRVGVGRAGNVLVGGDLYSSTTTDGAGRVFVDCYEALADCRPPQIFRPGFTRPYIYGLDVVAGYLTLMSRLDEKGLAGEGFNFGPIEVLGVPNGELASKICESWGSGVTWETGIERDEPFQAQSLDWSKAEERLGWRPAFDLDRAVEATTRWYRAWSESGGDPADGGLAGVVSELADEHRAAAEAAGIGWASA